jgi:hypothetical protein
VGVESALVTTMGGSDLRLRGNPKKRGGEMLIVSDEVRKDKPKQVTTAD